METIEAILTRRSIRHFTNKPVSEEQITTILKCAMYAPSALNQQPWHFIVIQDRKKLLAITHFHQYADALKTASVGILVCADENLERTKNTYWVQDCSAATQNMLLCAHSLGLGAVWLAIHPREQRIKGIVKLFELPPNIHPLSLLAIGYPAEKPTTTDRFKKERIHYDKW